MNYVLAFKQLYHRQTYLELAQKLDAIFADYGIQFEQITNIVTDGGSAFCKMFRVFGSTPDFTAQECDEEDDRNALSEQIDSDETNEITDHVQSHMQTADGEFFATEILDFQLDESSPSNTNSYLGDCVENTVQEHNKQIKMPKQGRCFSHLLNLLSEDFEKALPAMAKTYFVSAYSKIHSIWVLTHRSSNAKYICKAVLGRALEVPCETRWNSKSDALSKVIDPQVQPKINSLVGYES